MHANICAPKKYDPNNKSCFTLNQLIEMANAYNRYVFKTILKPSNIQTFNNIDIIKIKTDKPYLLLELKSRFKKVCNNDEICLTHQAFMNEIVKEMKNDIENNTFRPTGPHEPDAWLSTNDINNIMTQYETIYPNFKFFGAVPLDCNELNFCTLYNLNFDVHLKQKMNNLGIIFNLDKSGSPGSHWVALFIDLLNGEIYFCDSNGKPPIDNISEIINVFIKYHKNKTNKRAIYKYNNISYQTDNSECGIYSCNFIIRKLAGDDFDNIINNPLTFREINSCRNVYFKNNPSKYSPHHQCDPEPYL